MRPSPCMLATTAGARVLGLWAALPCIPTLYATQKYAKNTVAACMTGTSVHARPIRLSRFEREKPLLIFGLDFPGGDNGLPGLIAA